MRRRQFDGGIELGQRGRRGLRKFGLNDQAILVRASHQMRAFEDRFLTIGLPYRVIGGPRFYERQEIRDAMAYFRLAVSPDDDLAFERVVNTPTRGIGDKTLELVRQVAREERSHLLEADKKREEEKRPHFEKAKAVDAKWQPEVKLGKDLPPSLVEENIPAIDKGFGNLAKHIENVRKYGTVFNTVAPGTDLSGKLVRKG